MIECIFTLDYEIYGNGEGSLKELVYEPAEKLKAIFEKWNARFVAFVEVAELEMIEAQRSDPAINLVKNQVRAFHEEGFEIGLHLHPGWYNAGYVNGKWIIDYSEYNLCTLPKERIIQMIDRSIIYYRGLLDAPDSTPFSYRAGHLLFQPTQPAANVLSQRGIKVDSSVYKGGLWRQHKLDYRRALKNGYYWRFTEDANVSDPQGVLLELPVYTKMVPTWEMLTTKRVSLQQKGGASKAEVGKKLVHRLMDYLRLYYPLKFDICSMTINELKRMVDTIIQEDKKNPTIFRPIVAIGHTKDFVEYDTIDSLLSYLNKNGILVNTFRQVYHKCN